MSASRKMTADDCNFDCRSHVRQMGWIIEEVVDLICNEGMYRIYRKHGFGWALVAIVGPIALVAAIIALAINMIS